MIFDFILEKPATRPRDPPVRPTPAPERAAAAADDRRTLAHFNTFYILCEERERGARGELRASSTFYIALHLHVCEDLRAGHTEQRSPYAAFDPAHRPLRAKK